MKKISINLKSGKWFKVASCFVAGKQSKRRKIVEHNEKMKMALDSNLLLSINVTAFFSYILII